MKTPKQPYVSKRPYTFNAMRRALVVGWGKKGAAVADAWRAFNALYFGNRLKPLPIFLTPATPYGKRLGWTCCAREVTHIALAAPGKGRLLVADRNTLLHEMIHQFLHERGEDTGHDGEPWRREIMRLTLQITGKEVWAGAPTVGKRKLPDGSRASCRHNRPHPETGAPSLTQCQIACWPHDGVGIDLGGWFKKLATSYYT
jgi:hypothetical protein